MDERPELVTWRQGRSLPYGEGIAFWALGEIVKAECGILESDSPAEAEAKLERALPADDPDRPWLRARLAPLVGAPAEPASQEESFTAWRRFLEALAAQGPTVLVFEDLHWADDALLSFLEHVADWSHDLPLLLLCSARPELFEQHPTWAAGLRNATTVNLAPLTDEETARLIAALLERVVLPAETQQALLERAGGNPLYAEEFVRLLADREQVGEAVEQVPDSVQALIAARLDTLSPERKSLLQDAAVVGKVFWAGAVAEMGGRDERELEQALHELARKELVRPSRDLLDAGRGRVRLLAPAGEGRVLRADPPLGACRPAPHRGRVAGATGRRAGRGPGRRARRPLPDARSSSFALPVAKRRRWSSRGARSATSPWRESARSRSTSTGPSRTWPGRSPLLPRATRSARRCSSAGSRPRNSSRAGSARHWRHSKKRSRCTGNGARPWPPHAS